MVEGALVCEFVEGRERVTADAAVNLAPPIQRELERQLGAPKAGVLEFVAHRRTYAQVDDDNHAPVALREFDHADRVRESLVPADAHVPAFIDRLISGQGLRAHVADRGQTGNMLPYNGRSSEQCPWHT